MEEKTCYNIYLFVNSTTLVDRYSLARAEPRERRRRAVDLRPEPRGGALHVESS
jgi:hypothetical protein